MALLQPTTTVERGEVVHVGGNELMVKMEDGTLRDYTNISDSDGGDCRRQDS